MTSAQQAGASGAEGAGAAGSGSLSPEQIEERLRAQREALAATWERAKQGDSEASSKLAKAAAVAGGVVTAGIVLARLARR